MASELRRVWEPAWDKVVVVSTRLGDRLLRVIDRVIAKYSLIPNQPFFDPDDFSWVAPGRSGVEDDPARARRRPRLPGRAAELPGHLDRSAEPHRRRSVEDVLLLRLRVQERAELRPLPGDRAHRRADPRDADRDVLDPRAAQAASSAHRPVQGRVAVPPRPGDPRVGRPGRDQGRWPDRALGRRQEPRVRRHVRARGVERDRRDAGRAVRRRRAPAAPAGEGVQRLHDQGDRVLAVHPGRAEASRRLGTPFREVRDWPRLLIRVVHCGAVGPKSSRVSPQFTPHSWVVHCGAVDESLGSTAAAPQFTPRAAGRCRRAP